MPALISALGSFAVAAAHWENKQIRQAAATPCVIQWSHLAVSCPPSRAIVTRSSALQRARAVL